MVTFRARPKGSSVCVTFFAAAWCAAAVWPFELARAALSRRAMNASLAALALLGVGVCVCV
jgi:hypothetical protein